MTVGFIFIVIFVILFVRMFALDYISFIDNLCYLGSLAKLLPFSLVWSALNLKCGNGELR